MPERLVALADEPATAALARAVAEALGDGLVCHLHGPLGAGKSSFARALLQALGVPGRIKSPTYSLVEPYDLPDGRRAWHLDLYRIADPDELQWLGVDALGDADAVVLIEWPERGAGAVPPPDLDVWLDYEGTSRRALLRAATPRGVAVLQALPQAGGGVGVVPDSR